MSSEIAKSIQFICDEKGLNYDTVMEALQSALAAAYRKDFGNRQQNIFCIFDPETGDMKMWDEKEVAEVKKEKEEGSKKSDESSNDKAEVKTEVKEKKKRTRVSKKTEE